MTPCYRSPDPNPNPDPNPSPPPYPRPYPHPHPNPDPNPNPNRAGAPLTSTKAMSAPRFGGRSAAHRSAHNTTVDDLMDSQRDHAGAVGDGWGKNGTLAGMEHLVGLTADRRLRRATAQFH
jgi:hypothetical protein